MSRRDVVAGPILYDMAKEGRVVYTASPATNRPRGASITTATPLSASRSSPSARRVGRTPYYNRYATLRQRAEDARAPGINPHFLVTFRDGTKTMDRDGLHSNYTRLVPDIPACTGRVAGVDEMCGFRPKE